MKEVKMIEWLKEFYYINKKKIISYSIICCILTGFCFCSYIIYNSNVKENVVSINSETEFINEEVVSEKENEVNEAKLYVDIKGEVKNPGVYEVINDMRVNDIIKKAGGLTKNSNTRFVNLSKKVNDGDVIVIYSNKEIEDAMKEKIIYVETPCICEEVNNACIDDNIKNDNEQIENDNVLININNASFEKLLKLNGIGEAKAKAIVEYRENNGLFKSIDDIKNVSGISEKVFEGIKDFITI